MSETIRVLVVDDQALVREGLVAMLRTKPDIEIVGQAATGEAAVALARTLHPDVILMDLVMPGKGGIAAIREIKAEDGDARILVLSGFSEDAGIIESIRAGASGYILKSTAPDELVTAIRQTLNGEAPLNPAVARALVQQVASSAKSETEDEVELTDRELEILRLVARGLGNQEIGEILSISPRTVATHVSNMMSKLGVANRTQLALYALRNGLASLYDGEDGDTPDDGED